MFKRKANIRFAAGSTKRTKRTPTVARTFKRPSVLNKSFSKSFKRRFRPKKFRSFKKKSFRRRKVSYGLIKSLLPVVNYTTETIETLQVPPSLAISGKACVYYTPGRVNGVLAAPAGLGCVNDVLRMADILKLNQTNQVVPTKTLETKFFISYATQRYTVINQNQGQAFLTAYYLYCRRDIAADFNRQDPITDLGNGFLQRGIGTLQGGANEGIFIERNDPFQSHAFCSSYKVLKVTHHKLHGGQMMNFKINIKNQVINLDRYTRALIGGIDATFYNAFRLLSHRQGERFIMFKFSGQMGGSTIVAANVGFTQPELDFRCETEYSIRSIFNTGSYTINDPVVGYTGPPIVTNIVDVTDTDIIAPVNV